MTISAPDPYILPELGNGYPQGNQASGGRTLVSKPLVGGERTAVYLTLGHSLMSNTVNSLYSVTQAKNQNFNVYDGGCYATVEPLLGCQINTAQPASGCFFSRAGDVLIGGGNLDRFVHAPIAVGGSVVADWAAGGAVNGRILPAHRRLVDTGLTPTGIVVFLGANDHTTTQAVATVGYQSIISTIRGFTAAPIYIVRHSLFALVSKPNLLAAQAAVLDAGNAVYTGGDLETGFVSSSLYWDDTHYNATGAAAASTVVASALAARL
ncbi:MAG: hypothetical protein J0H42_04140 [Rhizobiales bacterium]|nr:hypothetical protein [Hyphomicrobiales bacterium]